MYCATETPTIERSHPSAQDPALELERRVDGSTIMLDSLNKNLF